MSERLPVVRDPGHTSAMGVEVGSWPGAGSVAWAIRGGVDGCRRRSSPGGHGARASPRRDPSRRCGVLDAPGGAYWSGFITVSGLWSCGALPPRGGPLARINNHRDRSAFRVFLALIVREHSRELLLGRSPCSGPRGPSCSGVLVSVLMAWRIVLPRCLRVVATHRRLARRGLDRAFPFPEYGGRFVSAAPIIAGPVFVAVLGLCSWATNSSARVAVFAWPCGTSLGAPAQFEPQRRR